MAAKYLPAKVQMPTQLGAAFHEILMKIAMRIGAPEVDESGTNISAFKTNYSTVLDRAKNGSVEVVTRGRQRFVILAEEQAVALITNTESDRTVAEVFAGLPTMPAESSRPRAMSSATVDHYRLPH